MPIFEIESVMNVPGNEDRLRQLGVPRRNDIGLQGIRADLIGLGHLAPILLELDSLGAGLIG